MALWEDMASSEQEDLGRCPTSPCRSPCRGSSAGSPRPRLSALPWLPSLTTPMSVMVLPATGLVAWLPAVLAMALLVMVLLVALAMVLLVVLAMAWLLPMESSVVWWVPEGSLGSTGAKDGQSR